ncbi:hypothetical protein O181_017651 [Austropuccinia psidii MF-1]|uniref:Uncharacterized protein n=1 Tax=Austropuccinia psidii MF-1 TaxID=1389203 RepID=A0A9Q3C806_9BASI|nr:hypothetical protein [Austropuccinia psidii MF-1]
MSPVHLRNFGILRNQPEDSGGWQKIEGNHTHSPIHFSIQQKNKARVLEGYGSSSSAPPSAQRSFAMEHGHKRFNLPSHLEELGEIFQKICLREIPFKELMEITKGWNPTGISNSWRGGKPA